MKKKYKSIVTLVIIGAGIGFDQLFKSWIERNLELGQVKSFIPNLMSLTHLQNDGMAWSLLAGKQWFFYLITPIIVLAAIYYLWKKMDQNWYFWALSLVIPGALGNFIDRVRQGYVTDMFQTDFINFPIFNIADVLLSVGFVLLFIAILTDKEDSK